MCIERELHSYEEAIQSGEADKWTNTIQKELQALEEQKTRFCCVLKGAVSSKLVFKVKWNEDGSEQYKGCIPLTVAVRLRLRLRLP